METDRQIKERKEAGSEGEAERQTESRREEGEGQAGWLVGAIMKRYRTINVRAEGLWTTSQGSGVKVTPARTTHTI